MKHNDMTREQLIEELARLQQENKELKLVLNDHQKIHTDQITRHQQEQLNMLLETGNDCFWEWDIPNGEMFFSPHWSKMLGFTEAELKPYYQTWQNLVHPDDIDAVKECMTEYLRGQNMIFKYEYRILTKTGQWKWIMTSGHIVARNNEGRPSRMAGVNMDITERKTNEIAILKSKAQLQTIIDNIPFYAWLCDNEGRFVAVNKTYSQRCRLRPDDIIGKTVFDIYPRKIADKYWQEDYEVIKSQQPKIGEDLILSTLWVEKYKIPVIDEKQNTIGMVGLLRDITEQKKFQREVERLERLNLVGEMAACIGHEIRNPMTTVRGYLQLLQENERYQEEREHFTLMIEELDRANYIITEYLSLAKDKVVELELTGINIIIRKLQPLLQAGAIGRDQHLQLELGEVPDILLDNKEICQLILNLVNNGMEAMSPGGTVIIRTFTDEGHVILAIQDEGHGIKAELLDKLGTPFFTTKEQGTGLGLAVCYRIANHHNATIDFETSPAGTKIYVRFPIS